MSVKKVDNTSTIILQTAQSSSLYLRYATEEIHRIADPTTPKDKGDLRRNVQKSVLGLKGTIKWAQKYAKIQETKRFQNYTTAGTGRGFAENAVKSVTNNPVSLMKKARLI